MDTGNKGKNLTSFDNSILILEVTCKGIVKKKEKNIINNLSFVKKISEKVTIILYNNDNKESCPVVCDYTNTLLSYLQITKGLLLTDCRLQLYLYVVQQHNRHNTIPYHRAKTNDIQIT